MSENDNIGDDNNQLYYSVFSIVKMFGKHILRTLKYMLQNMILIY